jgi:hypothetical protein
MTCQYSSRWLDIIIRCNFAWSIRALMTSRWSDDHRYTISGRITSVVLRTAVSRSIKREWSVNLRMMNQEDIIYNVYRMDLRELLGLIIEHPFFLTEGYFGQIKGAVQARYTELTRDDRKFYSF